MLIRQTLLYAAARIIPGIATFAAISIYTRNLSPHEYGVYVTLIALSSGLLAVAYQWVALSLLRFWVATEIEHYLLKTVALLYLGIAPVVIVVGYLFLGVFYAYNEALVVLTLLYIVLQGWFDINMELLRAKGRPANYGIAVAIRSIVSLAVAYLLIKQGWKIEAPLVGLIIGLMLALLFCDLKDWRNALGVDDKGQHTARKIFIFGAPLAIAYFFNLSLTTFDRILLAWISHERSAGLYAASFDLVWQVETLLFVTINLAAYPLAIKAYETGGRAAAEHQMRTNGTLLVLIGLPVTIAFCLLARDLPTFIFGAEYRSSAAELMPFFSIAAFIAGIRSYHFDIAFHLSGKTWVQLKILGVGAIVSLILNFLYIPRYGYMAPAYIMVGVQLLGIVMSVLMGHRHVAISFVYLDLIRVIFSACVFGVVLLVRPHGSSFEVLLLWVSGAGLLYAALLYIFNIMGIRGYLVRDVKGG